MDKEKSLYLHAKRRFAERYNLELTHGLHAEIVKQLKGSNTGGKQTCRALIHRIKVSGRIVFVIYDRKRECLITALTKKMAGSTFNGNGTVII